MLKARLIGGKKLSAYAMLFVSAVIFGFSFLFTKEALLRLSIFQLLGLRFLIAALIMAVLALTGAIKVRYDRGKLKRLALLTVFQPVLYFTGETLGIRLTSASESGMMIATMPVAIALFSMLILKERLVFHQWASVAASVAGVLLITGAKGFTGEGGVAGFLFLVFAIIAEGVFSPLSRKLSVECSPVEITFAIMCVGAVFFNAAGLAIAGSEGKAPEYFTDALSVEVGAGVLYLSALSSVAAFFMYNYALSKVKASTSASFCNLTTVVSVLAGVAIGGEELAPLQVAGMAVILLSIWGILKEGPVMAVGKKEGFEGIKVYRRADAGLFRAVKEFAEGYGLVSDILPENTPDLRDAFPSLFVYERDGAIAGVLRICAPGGREIEVTAFVAPDYRRRGIFGALLKEAVREAAKSGYRRGLFVCGAGSREARGVMEHWGFEKEYAEFRMACAPQDIRAAAIHSEISITEASEKDLAEMTALGTGVFGIDAASERRLLIRSLKYPGRAQWAVRKAGRIVGMCGTKLEADECMIYGLCILPSERKKGYAAELIGFVAGYAAKHGVKSLCLDVDTSNEAAIGLYRGCGFEKRFETSYYGFTFGKLRKILKKTSIRD